MTTPWGRIVASAVAIGLVAAAVTAVASPDQRPDRSTPRPAVSASLLRASAPSSPRSPKASGGNGHATVRWTAPLHTNGSPINAYLVWPYLGHTQLKAHEFHSKKTSEVVTGLSNGHQYTFRVAARNAVGIGPKSSASSAVWVRTLSDYWRPSSSAPISWNWQLQTPPPIPTNTKVQAFDIDGFDTSAATVAALHAEGTKVICYIDLGTYEPGRPDLSLIPRADIGSDVQGWPGEKWLNIADLSGLKPLINERIAMCASKGFDAIEPDNLDGYENEPGFPLTAQDQLTYNEYIANEAHAHGLSVLLKNDTDQTAQLEPYFDFALNEECNYFQECGTEAVFVNAGKAVFNAEYTSDGESTSAFCPADEAAHIDGVLFNINLDGSTYKPCTGRW
jgi:hypothetical protein